MNLTKNSIIPKWHVRLEMRMTSVPNVINTNNPPEEIKVRGFKLKIDIFTYLDHGFEFISSKIDIISTAIENS